MVYDIKRYHIIFPIGAPTSLPLLIPLIENSLQSKEKKKKQLSPVRSKTAMFGSFDAIHGKIDFSKTIFSKAGEKSNEKNELHADEILKSDEKRAKSEEKFEILKTKVKSSEMLSETEAIKKTKSSATVSQENKETIPDKCDQISHVIERPPEELMISIDPNYLEKISKRQEEIEEIEQKAKSVLKDIYEKSPNNEKKENETLTLFSEEEKLKMEENSEKKETSFFDVPKIIVKNTEDGELGELSNTQNTLTEVLQDSVFRPNEANMETTNQRRDSQEEILGREETKKVDENRESLPKKDYEIDYGFNICCFERVIKLKILNR